MRLRKFVIRLESSGWEALNCALAAKSIGVGYIPILRGIRYFAMFVTLRLEMHRVWAVNFF